MRVKIRRVYILILSFMLVIIHNRYNYRSKPDWEMLLEVLCYFQPWWQVYERCVNDFPRCRETAGGVMSQQPTAE